MLALEERGVQIKGAYSEEECQSRTAGALMWESGRYNRELYPQNPLPHFPMRPASLTPSWNEDRRQ